MTPLEEKAWKERYPLCKKYEERNDLIFVYPNEFEKDPLGVTDNLQKAVDRLKYITSLDPIVYFRQKIVIGYGKGGLNWGRPNCINIPLSALGKREEPEDGCSHELIHPFFRCSSLHSRNEGWGDGFCDFIRGPIKQIMGLDGNSWWKDMIQAVEDNKDGYCQYPAGQFIIKLKERNKTRDELECNLIDDHKAIKDFVEFLFASFADTALSTYLTPSKAMIKKWKDIGKI